MTANGDKTLGAWLRANIPWILSTALLLLTNVYAWGRVMASRDAQLASLQASDQRTAALDERQDRDIAVGRSRDDTLYVMLRDQSEDLAVLRDRLGVPRPAKLGPKVRQLPQEAR
jgi:hypothetical protein